VGIKQPATVSSAPLPRPACVTGRCRNCRDPRLNAASGKRLRGGGVSGGSEVYRIHPDGIHKKCGRKRRISPTPSVSTRRESACRRGKQGPHLPLDTDNLYTVLLNASPTRLRHFAPAKTEDLRGYGNIGKVYEIGAGLEREGSIESDIFDASCFNWGRLTFTAESNGGALGSRRAAGISTGRRETGALVERRYDNRRCADHFASARFCNGRRR